MILRTCSVGIGATLLAACTSLDPSDDRAALRASASTRTAATFDEPAPDTLAEEVVSAIRMLLEEPLTAERAVQIALLNNHRVRSTYERLGVGRAELVQAGLLRNPSFDLDVRFLEGGGTDMEFGITQPILELFFLPLRNRLAAHEYAALKLRLTDELVELVYAVRRAHVRARASEANLALHRRALEAADAALELMLTLHAAGNATDHAVAVERAGATRARLDLAEAEQLVREMREPLQRLLGLWGELTEWRLDAPLDPDPERDLDLQHVESRAIRASLELAAHREGLDALAQSVGLSSWRGYFPELGLGPNGIRIPGGTWGFGPRIEGELPIFDGGGPRTERASATLRAGLHDYTQLAVEIRSAARLLVQRLNMLSARARFYVDVHLPQQANVVNRTLQNYNAMQIGAFAVLEARQAQLAEMRAHIRTLRDAHLARLDLEQLLAGSLPESVSRDAMNAEDSPSMQRGKDQ